MTRFQSRSLLVVTCMMVTLLTCGCSSALKDVPYESRTAHVERVEHHTVPNAVDYGQLALDAIVTLRD